MRVLVFTAMYPTQEKPAAGTFVKEQVDSLRDTGVEVDVFAFQGKGSARNYLKAAVGLRQILRNKTYDLVHAHYGLTGVAALTQTACPVIVTYHGSDLLGFVNRKKKYTLGGKVRSFVSRAAAVGAKQRIVVANILKAKLWPMSAVTIPMGVDLSLFQEMPRFEARERLGYAPNRKIVLFAAHPGNVSKRFDIAQQAVDLLKASGFEVELLPLYNQPHSQIPLYMNACDVLVFTSMYEASPCVIKEAMACNLPIVSVNVGDVAERIEGIEGCHLCEPTPRDVALKLRQVLESGRRPDSRSRVAELSLRNIAHRVMAVYDQVRSARPEHAYYDKPSHSSD